MDFQRVGTFERFLEEVFWNRLRAPYNRSFAKGLGLEGHERVLEFGSGSGAISRHMAPLLSCRGSLVCVDTSKGLMDIARRRSRGHPHVEFREGDLRRLRLGSASFDAVVVHFVLHDIPMKERRSFVREFARILKTRGTLFVREPTRAGHGMSPAQVRDLARTAGLSEVSAHEGRRMGFKPYFSARFRKERQR